MAYKRLITYSEDKSTMFIDGEPLNTMNYPKLMLALSRVIGRLAGLEDKIEKGELVERNGGVNYEML